MNNKEFIARLSDSIDMSAAETQHVADTIIAAMGRLFGDGTPVQIPSFGTFEVKKHKERIMVNPASGQRMLVPPKLILSFKPASAVRGQIRKGGDA